MAKKKNNKGAVLEIQTSTGCTLTVQRPSMNMISAVQAKAANDHPYPEPPVEEIQTLTGVKQVAAVNMGELHRIKRLEANEQTEAIAALSEEARVLLGEIILADGVRNEHVLEFALQKLVSVAGVYTDDAKAEFAAQFDEQRTTLEEWGDIPDDHKALSKWQFALRYFVLGDLSDWGALQVATMQSMDQSGITAEELRSRVNFSM